MSLSKFIADKLEKLLGYFYEGPEPPSRIIETVVSFRTAHPNATPEEWTQMAVQIADDAYRLGYTRGLQAMVRDPGRWQSTELDEVDYGREVPPRTYFEEGDPNDPLRGVAPKMQADVLRSLQREGLIGYSVESVPDNEKKR